MRPIPSTMAQIRLSHFAVLAFHLVSPLESYSLRRICTEHTPETHICQGEFVGASRILFLRPKNRPCRLVLMREPREFVIDEMQVEDWDKVCSIYMEGLETGQATFEPEAPAWGRWDANHLPFARLVAREGGRIKGWAALSPVSARRVYAGVAEVSVYVGRDFRGGGVGRALLEALIQTSERAGIWTLQASIFPENRASIRLHIGCGFREVGRRERIAKLNGVWRDTILLERRSELVGTD